MPQPIKKTATGKKKITARSAPKKKKKKLTVGEIIKRNIERSKKPHPKYGTSKLETKFAKEFLDKLGVKYETQYYAESIKRYYDFYLPECRVLIEVDGDFFHSYGKLREEMSPMQKKNARVDEIKNEWAAMRGIPLLRIWEHDINDNPSKVMAYLKENIGIYTEKMIKEENKKKRH